MPRLLIFAATTGYQTRIFHEAAMRLGYDVRLATDRCHMLDDPWGDRAIPIRFENLSHSLKELGRAGRFDGVAAVGDRPALLAAQLAERMGAPFHPSAAARACHDKHLSRQLFQAAGLPVPRFLRVPIDRDPAAIDFEFPCVLKPLGLSASRGVIRADDRPGFIAAFERIRKLLLKSPEIVRLREEQNRFIEIESFIPGREFALEALMTRGEFRTLAIFKKPDPLDGPFFEETIYVTPPGEPALESAIGDAAARGARALGLYHGPVHAELRWNESGAWMLEAAARPIGGLCSRVLRFDGGMPLEELILRHAADEDVSSTPLAPGASGVMMIPIPRGGIFQSVEGLDAARATAGIEDVVITAKQGQRFLPLPEGSSYLGFIFARADSPEAVEQALRRAHSVLHFEISAALPAV